MILTVLFIAPILGKKVYLTQSWFASEETELIKCKIDHVVQLCGAQVFPVDT